LRRADAFVFALEDPRRAWRRFESGSLACSHFAWRSPTTAQHPYFLSFSPSSLRESLAGVIVLSDTDS
jgi:hypothetical protein